MVSMLALSVRQPFAELILRGIKTVEYRSRPTRMIGERFNLYASRKPADFSGHSELIWSNDLSTPKQSAPDWMLELARQVGMIEPGALLPMGMIVGSAVIDRCDTVDPIGGTLPAYRWHLKDVRRLAEPRKPQGRPQPVWFREIHAKR